MGQNIAFKPFIITLIAVLLVAYTAKTRDTPPRSGTQFAAQSR